MSGAKTRIAIATGDPAGIGPEVSLKAALAGEVDAVVAAPQNETSIALAGIPFDGYPSFVARATGMSCDDVFLMLCFGDRRIVHTTLHVGVVEAVSLITRDRVGRAIRAADGPYGADTMLLKLGYDAYVVMLHDQGHVAAKLLAPNAAAALTIGSPILFSSVGHGSALDIAGKGVASPKAMIEAVERLVSRGA